MLAAPVSLQSFQMVSRRTSHVVQYDSAVQLSQFSLGNSFDGTESHRPLPLMQTVSIFTAEALDHLFKI